MGLALEKLPDWPETLSRDQALAYTGLADSVFARLEKAGSIRGRKIGPRGAVMYLRDQLKSVILSLFGTGANDIDDEFESVG